MKKALKILVPITVIITILTVGYYYISTTNTKLIKDNNRFYIEKDFTTDKITIFSYLTKLQLIILSIILIIENSLTLKKIIKVHHINIVNLV